MSNYLKNNLKNSELMDYSLSNNNVDFEYAEIIKDLDIEKITELINKYPDYKHSELTRIIRNKFKIKDVVLGSGSEDLIIRTNFILKNKGTIGIFAPNFYRIMETAGKYKKIYMSYETESKKFNLSNISINKDIKSIWISNPNPIIGKFYEKKQLLKLIKKYKNILFIVDESAIDFLENHNDFTLINVAQKISNLMVIRSFSKLYGAAGLRIGFATGKTKIIREIEKIGMTFPVNGIAEYFAKIILNKKSLTNRIRRKIIKNKLILEKLLSQDKNIIICESVTNCTFLKHKKINLSKELAKMNIQTLSLDKQDGVKEKGFIRFTVHSSDKLFNNLYSGILSLLKKYEDKF